MRIFFRSKWVIFGAVLVLLIVLVVLTKIAFTPTNNLSTKNLAPTPTPKTVDLCANFPKVQGEITCEEAKTIAFAKYPGQLLSVDKTTLPYQPGKLSITQAEQRKVWLIDIKPNDISSLPSIPKGPDNKELQIIETIKVAIDRSTKEILFLEPSFKK